MLFWEGIVVLVIVVVVVTFDVDGATTVVVELDPAGLTDATTVAPVLVVADGATLEEPAPSVAFSF